MSSSKLTPQGKVCYTDCLEYRMKGIIPLLQPEILEDVTQLEVVTFDFKQKVLSVLSDPELM